MILYEKPRPLVKRFATVADVTSKIQRYDSDNLYPQRADTVFERASTLKALMTRVADFVNGEGFADQTIAKLMVNDTGLRGQTLNKVLQTVSLPYVKYRSLAMHIGYNLNGSISSITPIEFSAVRLGNKNKEGKVCKYAYSPDWTKGSAPSKESEIKWYHRFDPTPSKVLEQITEAGGIGNYMGQILYLTPIDGVYPLATFDAVYDDAQVQSEIALFKIANTQNSFLTSMAIVYPGEFASKDEELEFNNLIANKSGSRNAGGRIGLQDKTGTKKAGDIFQPLTPPNLDRLFEYTEKSIKENIIESEGFPSILLGKSPNGLFAQGDIEEAYIYANAGTRNRRLELSEIFSTLLLFWETPIQSDCQIIEQRYVRQSAEGTAVDVNDNLKNMTGMQAINFARILRKYAKGNYDRMTAETLLQRGFGLSSEEIKKLLDGLDQAAAEDADLTKQQPAQPAPQAVAMYINKSKTDYL